MNETIRRSVLDLMHRHGIGLFEYEGPDGTLILDAERRVQDHPPIHAAGPGLFFSRHPAMADARGWPRNVRKGETVGWLKIGPILKPLIATEDAIVRRPLIADGSLAGYGKRLF